MSEVKVSTKGQIVIPKDIRKKMGLRPGDKVKIEILEGKKAIIQPVVSPPEEIFVKATDEIVRNALREANKQDEAKIRRLLMSLGIRD
ncbi:MAG: AbrB/MazE/SpoVT family DNA-binding domain-containing protein [Thermoproteota archaeon]|jgi:AbrB family looped-hinge helix DNA binding protein